MGNKLITCKLILALILIWVLFPNAVFAQYCAPQYAYGCFGNFPSPIADYINNFSTTITESTTIFRETSTSIADSSGKFRDAMQELEIYTQSFEQLHQITQTNQEKLMEAIPIIIQEKQALSLAIESIKKLQPSLEKINLNIEISAENLNLRSQEFLQLQGELSQLTRRINIIIDKLNNKFLQGLGFDELHHDNQEIIDLLKKLTLNLDRSDDLS